MNCSNSGRNCYITSYAFLVLAFFLPPLIQLSLSPLEKVTKGVYLWLRIRPPCHSHSRYILSGLLEFCHAWAQLSRNMGASPLPAACMAPSGTVKDSQLDRSFQFSPNFNMTCSHDMYMPSFSSRVMLSNFGIQPTAVATSLMICGASGDFLANNSQSAHSWH